MNAFTDWVEFETKPLVVRVVKWEPARGAAGIERSTLYPGLGVVHSPDGQCVWLVRPGDWLIDHPRASPLLVRPEWVPLLLKRKTR